MDYSFIIRRATKADAPGIKSIITDAFARYAESVGTPAVFEALGESIGDIERDVGAMDVFVALIDDVPVGTVRVKLLGDGTAYLSRLGVLSGYNNIGIGKSMLNLIDKLLIKNGVHTLMLHTASENGSLVRFYYGRGFHIDSTTKDRGYIRALMVKELG